ncbi:sortase-associated OmpA-like protein PdsO [Paraglaciecola aquimarina]|uniref:Sortase-associated OmpA-like protein PdsO n=1 Tax=Paraglaciecola algarum TaxID=3050085 RepID=A0ABS9D4W2_9ALTE|nr:sortase-associated OmpA-like protein PdsO [Paraglaciecola sp. G1-23]MCF2947460.1 sortase-associated OmpA-like protein PdsO [Paraglaciecola sp. G1-23]
MKLSLNKKITAVAITCLLSGSVLANDLREQQKENEMIGLGSGVVVGTLIAGPLGGMVTGIIGLLIAEDVNSDKELKLVKQSLRQTEDELVAATGRFEQAKQVAMVKIASLDRALAQNTPELESNIQFKTGSYVLEDHYKSQLDLVAQTLKQNPKLTVNLSGFADQRGDNDFNQSLSEKRTKAVKSYLLNKSVRKQQVLTNSYGESSLVSAGANFEDDFFDRRVHVKVSDDQSAMTAANQ